MNSRSRKGREPGEGLESISEILPVELKVQTKGLVPLLDSADALILLKEEREFDCREGRGFAAPQLHSMQFRQAKARLILYRVRTLSKSSVEGVFEPI